MDNRSPDNASNDAAPQSEPTEVDEAPAQGEGAPKKTAAEYAETFNKAVDVAEQVLRFAPLPAGAKRVATRAMPTVKKVAKVAPMVAPAAEPYVRKAAAKAKEVAGHVRETAPKLGHAVSDGAKAAATRVHDDAPKLGRAAADKASRLTGKFKRKSKEG